MDHGGLNGDGNLQRLCVSGSKVIDYPGQQRIQESTPDLHAPGPARSAGQAHLRHHFPAERTLIQVRGDPFSAERDRKSTRLNSSHRTISYAVFCLKKKKKKKKKITN